MSNTKKQIQPNFRTERMPEGVLIVLENAADIDLISSAQEWITMLSSVRATFPAEKYEKTELSYEPRKNPGVMTEPSVLKAVIFSRK